MGLISKLLKTGLTIGALVTAYQATQKTKKETGTVDANAFVRNFKDQAIENTKIVADTVKSQLAGKPAETKGDYRVSDEGENGYAYPNAEGDKVTEIFEDMKEKAPEVIGKVQDIVEDLREKAPEYKEKAQNIVETVKDAARKVIDEKKKDDE